MDPDFGEQAEDRDGTFQRAVASMPSSALVAAMLERSDGAMPDRIDGWTVASTGRTSRYAVVLLFRPTDDEHFHCTQVFERADGEWRSLGGSAGSSLRAIGGRPAANESPVSWLGRWTLSRRRESRSTLRVTGGRARSDVARVVIETGADTMDVVPDEAGWFYVVLEGEKAATISARDSSGAVVIDLDGLPLTLRFE
jgi:hypothetical protein